MATKKGAIAAYNAARSAIEDAEIRKALPVGTENNIADVAQAVLSYVPVQNAFMSAIVNKFYLQLIEARSFTNPLRILKKGRAPLGYNIEEIQVNPVKGQAYNPTATTLLNQRVPDAASAYYTISRNQQYALTVDRKDLRHGFATWEALGDMFEANVNSLYSGCYIDEYRAFLRLMSTAPGTSNMLTQTVTAVTNEATGKALVKKLRALHTKFQFPSTEYNAYGALATAASVSDFKPRETWTPAENIVLIISADTEASIDVDVLAAAFNMSKADLLGRTLIVDSFDDKAAPTGSQASNIVAIIADDAWFKIFENYFEIEPFRNPQTKSTTYFLDVEQTIGGSPFANAVALTRAWTYEVTTAEPDDWSTNYKAYYTKSGDVYSNVTGASAPTWEASTYYIRK